MLPFSQGTPIIVPKSDTFPKAAGQRSGPGVGHPTGPLLWWDAARTRLRQRALELLRSRSRSIGSGPQNQYRKLTVDSIGARVLSTYRPRRVRSKAKVLESFLRADRPNITATNFGCCSSRIYDAISTGPQRRGPLGANLREMDLRGADFGGALLRGGGS